MDFDIYCIPGLGLNSEIYRNIEFENANVHVFNWFNPDFDESFDTYVNRFASQIQKRNRPLIIVGHSFGGIIAQELQKIVNADKLILLSTITSREELPFKLKILKATKIHRMVNKSLIKSTFHLFGRRHGYSSKELQKLVLDSIIDLSGYYFNWSVDQVISWDSTTVDSPILRIHGKKDNTFPARKIKEAVWLEDGDHLLLFKKGDRVSEIINNFIST